ncbi:MAG: CoB--CoM heterodisulfide reductase iron-sulfur subunit A family protein [Thermoleophilia bacterium]|nr:CoB--CoM heterodisulfide reductase iron-sulfur subunit A family protein [Thermoleophilia bacterium]
MADKVLIIGGGMSGITSAVEAAEAGLETVIVERNPYLGGRVSQLYKYFPKLCPPYCGLEINFRRIKQNPKISFYTQAEVQSVSGSEGDFTAAVQVNPRYVTEKCTNCGECAEACPSERPNDFNFNMDTTKAVYLPHDLAYPMRYVLDRAACGSGCQACADACGYGAIDLEMQTRTVEINASSIVMATGWNPYDASRIENINFATIPNVITNVMMERLAAPNGPTKGKIIRPSDGKEVKSIAFAQCAGSRDENNLPYCSSICCMASLKQATYLRDTAEDSTAEIFYIDLRAPGKYEDFLRKLEEDENVTMTKGKVAAIEEDAATGDPVVTVEDILGGGKIKKQFDMVVLASGMEPAAKSASIPVDAAYEANGFVDAENLPPGIFAAGVSRRPDDVATSVQDATGAALRSVQSSAKTPAVAGEKAGGN